MNRFNVFIENNRKINFDIEAENIDEATEILNDFMSQFDIFKFSEKETKEDTKITISEIKDNHSITED